ncbi:MAG: TIGR01906 family membrane protein [Clostridiales bacterium]|nr:TIGR01906 family membrane protein [Clostridiales bacterium]
MKRSKVFSILCSLLIALCCLTAAIAVPILCRSFYYAQIDALELVEKTGWSENTIRGAFDEVMDYLVKDAPFGTGQLKWSESGRSHFADCKGLFRLDFILLGASAAGLLILAVLRSTKRLRLHFFLGRTPAFWALIGTAAVLLLLTVWALVDFNSLFSAFHTLFFPGKTNWIFDYRTDQIILILPEAFWARAAALVVGLTLALEGAAVILGVLWRRSHGPRNVYEEILSSR